MQRHKSHKNTSQHWSLIGEKRIYVRSKWEELYAGYLEHLRVKRQIMNWEHEPKTFWFEGVKRGVVSYKPDFRVDALDGSHYWVEVKGFYDSKSKTKVNRFKKHFPREDLVVVDSKWFARHGSIAALLLKSCRPASHTESLEKEL